MRIQAIPPAITFDIRQYANLWMVCVESGEHQYVYKFADGCCDDVLRVAWGQAVDRAHPFGFDEYVELDEILGLIAEGRL